MAVGSHSKGTTLASELARLEIAARAAGGGQYSRSRLAEASGVPETKFVSWLMGDAVSDDDDGGLIDVVSILALWAGQSPPERRYWLLLAAATKRRQAIGIWQKLGTWLRKPAVWIGGIITAVIIGVTIAVVGPVAARLVTPGPASQPAPLVPFGDPVSRTNGPLSDCAGWLFPQPIQKIPYMSLGQNAIADEQWALSNGASDVNGGAYTIALQGFSTTDIVVIKDVRIKILSRKPAQAGTVIYNQSGCGGALTARVFTVQVDSPDPQFVAQNGAPRWPYTISSTDPWYLILDAQLSSSDQDAYQFVYQIDWSQGSRQGTVTVTAPNGKPFTAAPLLPGSTTYYGENGHWSS